jgi:hypothetical protein
MALQSLKKFAVLSTIGIFIFGSFSRAQSAAAPDAVPAPAYDDGVTVPPFWNFVTDLPDDMKIFGRELIDPENAPFLIGLGVMTAVTTATDYESWQAAKIPEDESEFIHKFANQGVSMGDGFFQFGVAGGFFAAGALTGNKRFYRATSQLFEAIFATGLTVQILKHVTGRESPFSSESRTGVWRMFPDQREFSKDQQKFDAMPSGHLSTAVTTLIVIQDNFPDQPWIPYVGWPIMGWISYGLVATSIHWWSDFPIAIAIGYSFAKIVTRVNHPADPLGLEKSKSAWNPDIFPAFSSEGDPILVSTWSF